MNNLSIDMAATGANLRKIRRERALSAVKVSELVGLTSPQAVYRWERGETLPTMDNLVILASVYHMTVDEIIVVKG